MEFESEAQLVALLENVYGSNGDRRWVWLREFNTSSGIADLVGAGLTQGGAGEVSLGRVPPKWAYALHCLPCGGPFSADHLAGLGNVTVQSARSILKLFEESGFCERILQSNQWIKTSQPEPVADRIVAVEAKLRDWRRALYQAAQHSTYASYSWVVLDRSALASTCKYVSAFQSRGVGLAGLSADGEIHVVTPARKKTPRAQARYWQANAEIARRLL